jgi:lipopolysaccharide export system protein LptA
MRGDSIDLKYRSDGETLEHVLITGAATVEIAGAAGSGDRVIAARTLEASLAPDGSTPTALVARDDTALTMPADKETPARSIRAQTLDGRGAPGQGLTSVRFAGGVQFVERGADVARSAQSAALDVTLAPGLKEIDEARFAQGVRFEEGRLRAAAAAARYGLKGGTLELSGSEPAMPTPQVVNDRISVYATRIDVTLSGPTVKATGAVKSELKPAAKDAAKKDDTKLPSMFKEDKLVAATAGALVYDGPGGKATYSGTAQLWQGDTSIKATEIVLDEKRGDLTASGSVVTSIALEQETKDKRKERVQTTASSREFQYQESDRRATYVGEARATGPQGDVTAAKIELYLKESGDELERAEAYETVTLRDGKREITGARMTYVADEQQYVITGSPVVIKDECGGETLGKRVTFNRRTDVIVVDGSEIRTQTRGTTKCS